MKLTHEFEVIVSRINEGLHQEPYETFQASDIRVGPDGTLHINTASGSRTLSPGLWEAFEVKRRTTARRDDE